uniref:Protein XRI1 n=1 Tax=Populus trichocarpa TaxID=3694 RepID=A0A3N7GTW6_POPTR|eukprot:XP_002312489.3 protein XRI1 [Populus trichocarpa]
MLLLNSYYHNSYSFSTNTTSINSTHLHHSSVNGSPGHQVTTAPCEMIVCQNNYTETKIRAGFELHSMAYYKSIGGAGLSSLGWDLQSLGVLRADMSLESDFSTGYLEDALLEFNEPSKRRRLLLFATDHDDQSEKSNHLPESNWNEENFDDWELMSENFSCMSHITGFRGPSDELVSTSVSNTSDEANVISEITTPGEKISAPETLDYSSSSSYKDLAATNSIFEKENSPHSTDDHENKRRKRVATRVVYPFALVKPGGVEGDMTINDINERILMPPTRPVRHPVGDFACRPCVSADGPGLSGKAVVALTRIHTQGRGTITIIRTKG